MSLFTLPIPPGLVAAGPRARSFQARRGKKRKRASSQSPSISSDEDNQLSLARAHNSLPAASTNPLSLAPSEVLQYRLAGLELDEQLPSTTVRDFPHRGLPPDITPPPRRRRSKSRSQSREKFSTFDTLADQDATQEEPPETEKQRRGRKPRLRTHHWGVLTTLLHKCLLDGDIPRASRAWALLIRAEIAGKGIEIRQSGYWGIGAELLIRSQESKGKAVENGRNDGTAYSTDKDENNDESGPSGGEKRWGTSAGIEKAKEYFERLILQHPYMRQYHGSVTALDFWPAMLGCELYGIQFDHKEVLKKISREEEQDDEDEASSSDESESEDEDGDEARERRRTRRRIRRREKRWKERDEIRNTTLVASEKVAARMDELMSSLPYSESHAFLRLRGMLALYIADLYVPELPEDDDDAEEENRSRPRSGAGLRTTKIQRRKAYESGKRMQEEERIRAKKLFEKLARQGGRVGIDLRALSPDPTSEEDEDAEEYNQDDARSVDEEYSQNERSSEDEEDHTVAEQITDVHGNDDDNAAEDTDESMRDVYEDNLYRRNAFNERDSGSDTDT